MPLSEGASKYLLTISVNHYKLTFAHSAHILPVSELLTAFSRSSLRDTPILAAVRAWLRTPMPFADTMTSDIGGRLRTSVHGFGYREPQ
jgi:hypothetical protein